jgi:hypothetical protein
MHRLRKMAIIRLKAKPNQKSNELRDDKSRSFFCCILPFTDDMIDINIWKEKGIGLCTD